MIGIVVLDILPPRLIFRWILELGFICPFWAKTKMRFLPKGLNVDTSAGDIWTTGGDMNVLFSIIKGLAR